MGGQRAKEAPEPAGQTTGEREEIAAETEGDGTVVWTKVRRLSCMINLTSIGFLLKKCRIGCHLILKDSRQNVTESRNDLYCTYYIFVKYGLF